MPSQFQNALRALQSRNTKNFNTRYSKEGIASRPKTPPSQFQSALRAYHSRSPTIFNAQYPNSPVAVGGLSSPRTPKKTRSRTKKARRGAITPTNAAKIKGAFQKPPVHPSTRKRYNPMYAPRRVLYMNNNNVKKEYDRLQSLPRFD